MSEEPLLTAQDIVRRCAARELTIAVAESLTGGLLTSALIDPAGASQVVTGGVVAYSTELKSSVLGVEPELLREHGPVHPEVARQLAANVREVLAIDGTPASVGIATTGVAGPEAQGEASVGTVFLGLADANG
ncbi:MAG TPA: nicotinamide-nucleotide amidohydrolase family protein, partial [Terrimesophilobacter sp.]|nr:nicotinamide-nucleotide amidohydrolase family protein [Terrimesophilobacter sp.]